MADYEERALGALYGLAVGDALGMPTQMWSRQKIKARFPHLDGLVPGPRDNTISRGEPAGRVTDDTEQALLLADLLVEGCGRVDARAFAERLWAWAELARQRGSDPLGPSSRRAVEAVRQGVPVEEAGLGGLTDGAAMRIAPLGVAAPPWPLAALARRVAEAVRVTHNTGVALAGASAVAAAVSLGVEGATFAEQCAGALEAARAGQRLGREARPPDIAERIGSALAVAADESGPAALDAIAERVGTGVETEQAVPAAFAVWALHPRDPWHVCLDAAVLGGDTDTIAAMAGAMAGAGTGVNAFPGPVRRRVTAVNELKLEEVAAALLRLRVRQPPRDV